MADPEIQLPPASSDTANEEAGLAESTATASPSNSERTLAQWDQIEPEDLSATPISYHYLTFETELPYPTTLRSIHPNAPPAPEPPDLVKYISPFDWSPRRKSFIIWLSCAATTVTAYTAGSYSPGVGQMTDYWHVSDVAMLVGITTFTTGFGIAPMVLAPFSEINGRKPVFLITGMFGYYFCVKINMLTQLYSRCPLCHLPAVLCSHAILRWNARS